ncbi:hypothetical protein ACYQR9_10675 [Methylobacterium sp. CM6241]
MPNAEDFALSFHSWAKENGYLANDMFDSPGHRVPLSAVFPQNRDIVDIPATDILISRIQISAVFHDNERNTVTICTRGAIPLYRAKAMPESAEDVSIRWIGSCSIQSNPPPTPPTTPITQRSYRHNGLVACGSSVHPASIHGAGTFGCLVRDPAGTIYGMSNNHVTGGCNHMEEGMPILTPAALDASSEASHPVPETLGRHARSIPLRSGDLRIVPAQTHDAAIFTILDPSRVTSMQGDGAYDTPAQIFSPHSGVRVKKIGRSTGQTTGSVLGTQSAPVAFPYNSDRFRAHVYIGGGLAIEGDNGQPFSGPGDSGSLVVTEDGQYAVGLIMGSMGHLSLALPIDPTLTELGVSLVSGYSV